LHHLATGGQIGARQRMDKQRTGRHPAGDLQRMTGEGREPDATARRHNPAAILGFDPHHAAQRVDQLGAIMLVPRLAGTVRIIMRQRHQRTLAKIKARRTTHRAFR